MSTLRKSKKNLSSIGVIVFPLLFKKAQFVRALQIHPEFRTAPQIVGKPQSGIGGERTLAPNNFINSAVRDMNIPGQLALADFEGL